MSTCAPHGFRPSLCKNLGGDQTDFTKYLRRSIRDYLIDSNVQLGATYNVGKKATSRYEDGYQAAARYINASREEIGMFRLTIATPSGR
jgi:hypothetical protein